LTDWAIIGQFQKQLAAVSYWREGWTYWI